jgi:2-dehydro-3-deoxygluconokinase
MGVPSVFVTKLPENDVADSALLGWPCTVVGTTHVVRGGDRIGVYYLERCALAASPPR